MFQVPEIPNIYSRLTLGPGNILALCELTHLILNFIMLIKECSTRGKTGISKIARIRVNKTNKA